MHIPVLLGNNPETSILWTILRPSSGETVLDVTLGLGGHAKAFLRSIGKEGFFIGLDADQSNLERAREYLSAANDQVRLIHANFRTLPALDLPQVDILFADLGLSSPHVDEPDRGFSFRTDSPLDLRFDRTQGKTASDLIEKAREGDIADVLFRFGELRESRRLERAIFAHRINKKNPWTTFDLRKCVEEACGYRAPQLLPQVFQALRLWVNDELGALATLLENGPLFLKSGGRMGIISYHSLEDRLIKQAFRALSQPKKDPRTGQITEKAPFTLLTPKGIAPSAVEIAENPRARSARFRALQKI